MRTNNPCFNIFKFIIVLLAVLAAEADFSAGPIEAACLEPDHKSYTTTYTGDAAESPYPCVIEQVITGEKLGCGNFREPLDVFVAADGKLFIADTGNNRVIVLGKNLQFIREYIGAEDTNSGLCLFKAPQGVFVTENGELYIADTENSVIVHMDAQGRLIRRIEKPESSIISETMVFKPSKVVVDSVNRIFVVSLFVNQGIIQYSPEGQFEGFLAAGKVNPSPVEVFWKRFSTAEQRARMVDFVPIEYNNLAIDNEGFIFATMAAMNKDIVLSEIASKTGTEEGTLVRRLNMLGNDILRREGFFPPVGDVDILDYHVNLFGTYQGPSTIVDVSCGADGLFSLLDNNRKRIFTYDSEGNMLFAFGGPNSAVSGFVTPLSMAQDYEHYYVLDKQTGALTVFKITDYGRRILNAIHYYELGQYDESAQEWNQVLARNTNMELAYSGIGKALYSQGRYEEAMQYFKNGSNKTWYSKAYKEYRKKQLAFWFPFFLITILAIYLTIKIIQVIRKVHEFIKKGI